MSCTDTIADFLTRIRNGYIAGRHYVDVEDYKMNLSILDILHSEGFIASFEKKEILKEKNKKTFRFIRVFLRYTSSGRPAIVQIDRISKPGRRVYKKVSELKSGHNGFGVYIVSTVKGLLTDHAARQQRVSGEILCYLF